MGYMTALKTAILVFPLIALFFTTFYILHQYHKYGSVNRLRTLIIYSFILYLICAYFLVILPLPNREEVTTSAFEMMRLVPFSFISDIARESSFVLSDPHTYLKALTEPCVYTVLLNIVMTIPFGMYLRYYFECNLKKTVFFTFLLSPFFEVTQLTGLYFIYPGPYRLFDVDDLIMNTLGGLIGYCLMSLPSRLLPSRQKIDADSFRAGMHVSGLRRLTIFLFDIFLYGVMSLFFRKTSFYKVIFGIYFVAIPLLTNGRTLGMLFLNVRLSMSKNVPLTLIARTLLIYFYYFEMPLLILRFASISKNSFTWPLFEILAVIFTIVFYTVNFVRLLKNDDFFYDRILGVTYRSTVNLPNEQK